jgi:P-type E1-E2 ATPase
MLVFMSKMYMGMIAIADVPRAEARASIAALQEKGIRVILLTGDNDAVAKDISQKLGITEFCANMLPEEKLNEISSLSKEGVLVMVGDGINDAPALARANIGIAMGDGGAAVTVEAANIVILTDEIERIPEMIRLAKRTVSVVNADMGIWFATNALGMVLVFTGGAGPPLAAFYNFATDFIPLLNSARLFRGRQ